MEYNPDRKMVEGKVEIPDFAHFLDWTESIVQGQPVMRAPINRNNIPQNGKYVSQDE